MDFEFSEDTLMLRDMLRRFISKEAQPLEMKYFTAGSLSDEESARLRRAVEQMGLWGLAVPENYGGGGLDLVSTCLMEEELGQTFIPVEIGDVPVSLYASVGSQVSDYLEPALAGERRAIIAAREPGRLQPDVWTTTAESDKMGGAECFVINGCKSLAFSPDPDDFLIVYARAAQGPTAFLLDAGGSDLVASSNGEVTLAFKDCRVGRDAVLGEAGAALMLGIEEAPGLWVRTGARYVGMVTRLIKMASEHARDWNAFGDALAVRPAVQRMLAEMQVEVESSRWLVYHAAWLIDTNPGDDHRYTAAQVRLGTGEMLQRAVDRVTMIYAGPGPAQQIEPYRFVHSIAPPEVLEFALEQARAVIAAAMLKEPVA